MQRWSKSKGRVGIMRNLERSSAERHLYTIGHLSVVMLLFCLCVPCFAQKATTAHSEGPVGDDSEPAVRASKTPDQILSISNFVVDYDNKEVAGKPDLSELNNVPVTLGVSSGIFYEKTAGMPTTNGLTFKSLSSEEPRKFERKAIRTIDESLRDFYQARGFLAVLVVPLKKDVDRLSNPKVPENTDLHITIYLGVVTKIRTIASGDRFHSGDRIDLPAHQFIRDHSPVTTQPSGSLIHKGDIDDYVLSLNRHPGRHVDVAISQADDKVSGDVVVDYLVAENKAWNVTLQASNTGTRQTEEWRERASYTNNQLTQHDDILTIDGVTTNFSDKSESISASYEAPFFRTPLTKREVRWRVFGSYDAFTASDLGNNDNTNFIGEQSGGGGEIIANLWQRRDKFVDAFGGAQYNHIRTNLNPGNKNSSGSADVIEPYLGLRAASSTDTSDVGATITGRFGHSFDRRSPDGLQSLDALGRTGVNVDWPLIQADATDSFFIEPIIYPNKFKNGSTTLANEMQFSLRGQTSLGRRLIPQEEEAVGGLYSVRGYPESIIAGDDVVIFTAEYRLHVPRLLKVQSDPSKTPLFGRPFRYSPQETYGRPDWDFVVRTFFDGAFSHAYKNTSAVPERYDHGLFGVGVGLDFTFNPPRLPYFDIRCDWGIALRGIDDVVDEQVHQFDNRFSFLFTTLF